MTDLVVIYGTGWIPDAVNRLIATKPDSAVTQAIWSVSYTHLSFSSSLKQSNKLSHSLCFFPNPYTCSISPDFQIYIPSLFNLSWIFLIEAFTSWWLQIFIKSLLELLFSESIEIMGLVSCKLCGSDKLVKDESNSSHSLLNTSLWVVVSSIDRKSQSARIRVLIPIELITLAIFKRLPLPSTATILVLVGLSSLFLIFL